MIKRKRNKKRFLGGAKKIRWLRSSKFQDSLDALFGKERRTKFTD